MTRTSRRASVRITVGALVAAVLCVGSASGALAAPVGKNNSKGQAALKKQFCADMGVIYTQDLHTLSLAHKINDQDSINEARDNVNTDINVGYAHGCSWAA
jgi:hypothetical protein